MDKRSRCTDGQPPPPKKKKTPLPTPSGGESIKLSILSDLQQMLLYTVLNCISSNAAIRSRLMYLSYCVVGSCMRS